MSFCVIRDLQAPFVNMAQRFNHRLEVRRVWWRWRSQMQLCPFTVFSLFACLLVLKKTQTKSDSAQSQVILLIKTPCTWFWSGHRNMWPNSSALWLFLATVFFLFLPLDPIRQLSGDFGSWCSAITTRLNWKHNSFRVNGKASCKLIEIGKKIKRKKV